jgi:molybdopterin synthase sulfur carrier subunit
MATVFIPAALRRLTGGEDRVEAAGSTVREVIEDLERRFPGIRKELMEGSELSASLAVAVDGEILGGGLLEPVREGSEIHFLPAIGGG